MIAKGDTYPTAMLLVFKLTGDFDVNEADQTRLRRRQLSQNFKRSTPPPTTSRAFRRR